MFLGREHGAGDVIGCYYRSLVYSAPAGQKHLKETHGKGVMTGTAEKLSKQMFKIPYTVVDRRGADQASWIVPTPFSLCLVH